jgi:hypothetical protein
MGIILEQGMFFLWLIVNKVNEKLSSKEIISKVMKYSNSKEYNLHKLVYDYKGIVFSKNSSQNNYFLSEPNLDNYNHQNIFPCNKKDKSLNEILPPIYPTLENFKEQKNLNKSHPKHKQQSDYNIKKMNIISRNSIVSENKNFSRKMSVNREISNNDAYFLKYLCCLYKDSKIKSKILEIGEKKIRRSLDIVVYLRKIQEMDVLRHTLLTNNEKNLYDFLSNPILTTDEKKTGALKHFYCTNEYNSDSFVKNLLDSYKEISFKKDKSHSEISLLELFETEMECLEEEEE